MPLRILSALTFLFGQLVLSSQDTLIIPEALVQSGFSEDPASAPRNLITFDAQMLQGARQPALDGILENVPGLDARQRGVFGAQTDLSLRGGSFEQVALWVDGMRWSAPHTGHHLLNLPIDPEDITRLRVVRGGSGALGSGGVTGGIIIDAGPADKDGIEASIESGSFGWSRARLRADWGTKSVRHRVSLSRTTTQGFRDNTDLLLHRLRYAGRINNKWGVWNLRLGRLGAAFGAQDFYTANFPQQYEEVGLWQGQMTWRKTTGDWMLNAGLQFRHHRDRFELFREGEGHYTPDSTGALVSEDGAVPSWYQGANLHRSNTRGARFSARRPSGWGETLFSLDARSEGIVSNRLGIPEGGRPEDSTFVLGDRRTHLEITAGQRLNLGRFTASALANWTLNSAADSARFTPEASLTCRMDETGNAVAFASVRRSIRMPSFTDLYYTVGGAQGSLNLLPEEADHLEFGFRLTTELNDAHQLVLSQHLFHRWGRNLIDWVRFNGSPITEATNLRAVHFSGQEITLSARAKHPEERLRHFTLGLSLLQADETSRGFESNYVLDVLGTKVDAILGWKASDEFLIDLRWSAQDRLGGYFDPIRGTEVEFDPIQLLGITVLWSSESIPVDFHLRIDNLLDEQYVDIGNVDQPGRWIRGGFTWSRDR
jgi:iron complex outermembrane receptor protein